MKILIVEDDPISRHLLKNFLNAWGYDVLIAENGRKAWDILCKPEAPNLIISDWMMPDMDGLELCALIRAEKITGYVYFILLTSKKDKQDVVEGLKAGADDFVVKPFDQEELQFRVKIGERIITLEQRIMKLARTDALTGLLNRGAFMERLEQEFQRARRENILLSLIIIDIDYFKKINDNYGHQVGDLVLQEFAGQLKKILRPYDLVARYGGEEFAVILTGAVGFQVGLVAERIRQQIARMKITLPDNARSIQISASFGTASVLPMPGENIESLIKQADDALYKAKDQGRNRVCSADARQPYKMLTEKYS